MPLQSAAPLRRKLQCVNEGAKKRQIAELEFERFEPGRAQRFHGQGQRFVVCGRTVIHAQYLGACLVKLCRPFRLRGLMAKRKTVVAKPRREFAVLLEVRTAERDCQIRAQAQFTARRICEFKRSPANFFASAVEEDLGGLEYGRLDS